MWASAERGRVCWIGRDTAQFARGVRGKWVTSERIALAGADAPRTLACAPAAMNDSTVSYRFSCDRADQQAERIHAYLTRSYWAEGIGLELVRRCIAGSLCCGAFAGEEQIGFARAVTDAATFAYLADVYVLEEHRSRGVADRMLRTLFAHPDLQGLRRIMLNTRDAHRLYHRFGFVEAAHPERIMEIVRPGLYLRRRDP